MSEAIDRVTLEQIKSFAERVGPAVKLLSEGVEAFKLLCRTPGAMRAIYTGYIYGLFRADYAAAGYPYGKSQRGFKKWMKRR